MYIWGLGGFSTSDFPICPKQHFDVAQFFMLINMAVFLLSVIDCKALSSDFY